MRLTDSGLPSRCWELLRTDGGRRWPWSYPLIYVRGEQVSARRLCFARVNGPIPDAHVVMTRCGNHHCLNPEHLFLQSFGEPNYRTPTPVAG